MQRKPVTLRCSRRRTISSGEVFFPRIRLMFQLLLSGVSLSLHRPILLLIVILILNLHRSVCRARAVVTLIVRKLFGSAAARDTLYAVRHAIFLDVKANLGFRRLRGRS